MTGIGLVAILLSGAAAGATGGELGLVPAFPGAEGFGAGTSGGRGGRVIPVTSLLDSGPGSLRAALEAEGPRTVVFRVSGTIDLRSRLAIRKPRVTVAGQTAPGDGVCIRGHGISISADEVILRYLRIRPGDESGKENDAISIGGARNVIVDHCSTSWAVDEVLSVSGAGTTGVTVQWCIIAESLNRSVHAKGAHGYGSLIRTDGDVTFHHNLYAHHESRNPRPGTYGSDRGIHLDFRNNAVYDWGSRAGYTAEDRATINLVGNWYRPGPSTRSPGCIFRIGGQSTRIHASGNLLVGRATKGDDWLLIEGGDASSRLAEPIAAAPVRTDSAEEALRRILEDGGAALPARDAVDRRIVEAVRTGGGRIIDSQRDVGGWPELPGGDPPVDSDSDGMPDAWEKERGLDPADARDGPADSDGDGYTNLEEHLNRTDPRGAEGTAGATGAAPAGVEPGDPVDISDLAFFPERWKAGEHALKAVPWTGKRVVFLTPGADLDRRVMARFLERLDGAWTLYEDLTGGSPSPLKRLGGKPTILALPGGGLSCGQGCGYLGATGIEVAGFSAEDYPLVASRPDAFPHYYFYEMGRNYSTFGARHSQFTCGFAVFMRYVCMDALRCVDPDRGTRRTIEEAERLHAESEMGFLEAFTTVAGLDEKHPRLRAEDGSWIQPSDQPVLYASAMLRLRKDCGRDEWVRRFFRELAMCPEVPGDGRAVGLRQSLSWLVAASCAARKDLTPVFVDRWRLSLSADARRALGEVAWGSGDADAARVLSVLPRDPFEAPPPSRASD